MITEATVVRRFIDWFMMILISSCTMISDQCTYGLNCLNLKYWNKIINSDVLVEEGVTAQCDRKLLQYAETAEQAWHLILESHTINGNNHSNKKATL